MATPEPGIFEIIDSTRAMKRLKPDPVPEELLRKVLDAISLGFDAVDVARFLQGDRAETVPDLQPPFEAIRSRA